jgi:hypothetical protein
MSQQPACRTFLVESEDESVRYGCLPLVTPRWKPPLRVYVSERVPCRGDVNEDEFWPARWEHEDSD